MIGLVNDSSFDLLFQMLETPSPSGWETQGQRLWVSAMRPVSDRVESDAYGNAWATRDGSAPWSVMLAAHADEIGFVIRHIDDKGFLSLGPLAGSDRTIAEARRVRFFGDRGPVDAVIGHVAIHLRDREKEKLPEWKNITADVGARSAEEVAAMGLRVGHPGVLADGPWRLPGGQIAGRALDNRAGGFLLERIFRELATSPTSIMPSVAAVNAVQEEVGGHGARMIAHRLMPRVALVFDVTHDTSVPGIDAKEHGLVRIGGGPALSHGGANHPAVVARLLACAEHEAIAVQHEAVSRSTRTDADVIYASRDGIPTALISIPLRNMHSPVEIIDPDDLDRATRLVSAFLRSMTPGDDFRTVLD